MPVVLPDVAAEPHAIPEPPDAGDVSENAEEARKRPDKPGGQPPAGQRFDD
jgi:hypothetical protein